MIKPFNRQKLRDAAHTALETYALWLRRSEDRHSLAVMSERDRRDIAVTWVDIANEVNKPFWR